MLASSFIYSILIILAWSQYVLGGLLPTRVSRIFPSRIIPKGHLVEERQAAVPVATTQPQNISNTNGAETHKTPAGNQTGPAPGFLKPPTDINADQVDCHDLTTGRSNKCWKELDLSSWVENWLETHWCHNQEGFSECFLRQNGFPALDCSAVKLDSCSPPQSDSVNSRPEQFYVAYNIYGKSKLLEKDRGLVILTVFSYQPIFRLLVDGSGQLCFGRSK